MEPFKVMGIGVRTTNENNQATKEIAELWQRFMSENILAEIPNKVDNTAYSLYADYERDHTQPYTAILGCRVENLNEMMGKSFDGGNYIKATARGDLMKGLIVNQWAKIFEMELDRTFTADFEVFGEKTQNPSDAEVDFYIAVRK